MKTNRAKFFGIIALVAIIGVTFAACNKGGSASGGRVPSNPESDFEAVPIDGGGKSALVGKWVSEDGNHVVELFKDGSGIWTEWGEKAKITWKATENGVFTITFPHDTKKWDYKISGSVLTFDNNGFKNGLVLKKSK